MNELDKQWQEDVEKYINPEKMWEYLGINNGWIDVPSPESMAVLPYVRRKESAELDFDKAAALAGDAVEVLIRETDNGNIWKDVTKIAFDGLSVIVEYKELGRFWITNKDANYFLRMAHPRCVGVDYSKFEDLEMNEYEKFEKWWDETQKGKQNGYHYDTAWQAWNAAIKSEWQPIDNENFIYEVRDVTDDEIYYTLGLFLTKELAIEAIKSIDRHGNDYYNYEECAEYEVVIHKNNCFYEPTKKDVIFRAVFKEKYNEEKDENEWEILEENYFN